MDAFLLTGTPADSERLIALKAPWKFDGESSSYPQSGYVAGRGWWTKFSDGTLIQQAEYTGRNFGTTIVYGSGTYGSSVEWVFPIKAVGDYSIDVVVKVSGRGVLSGLADVYSTTNVYVYLFDPLNNTPYTMVAQREKWLFVGRWKA